MSVSTQVASNNYLREGNYQLSLLTYHFRQFPVIVGNKTHSGLPISRPMLVTAIQLSQKTEEESISKKESELQVVLKRNLHFTGTSITMSIIVIDFKKVLAISQHS